MSAEKVTLLVTENGSEHVLVSRDLFEVLLFWSATRGVLGRGPDEGIEPAPVPPLSRLWAERVRIALARAADLGGGSFELPAGLVLLSPEEQDLLSGPGSDVH